jgi:ABC-type Na+ transport system ATPase subunit NatA
MSHEQVEKFIQKLKNQGYAVAIFSPQDLGNVEADLIEEILVKKGWEAIAEDSGILGDE